MERIKIILLPLFLCLTMIVGCEAKEKKATELCSKTDTIRLTPSLWDRGTKPCDCCIYLFAPGEYNIGPPNFTIIK